MDAPELSVRRLRLAAGARLPPARVEDALRISSKPAALLHRHVLVRRLRLRTVQGASAQSLARQFEQAWQRIAAQARPIELAGDADDAVWAESGVAARIALIGRWACGEEVSAWFWQRIAALAPAGDWPMRALALMLAPLDESGVRRETAAPSAAERALVEGALAAVVQQGAAQRFVTAIGAPGAAALAALLEGTTVRHSVTLQGASVPIVPQVDRRPSAAERLLVWMSALAIEPDPLQVLRAPGRSEPGFDAGVAGPQAHRRTGDAVRAESAPLSGAVSLATDTSARSRPDPAEVPQGVESAWAGLWLLLPILLRHGLAEADDPFAAWVGAMHAACRRFALPPDEVLRTQLAQIDPEAHAAPDWLRRARLAAVHDARLPLRRIARRPGAAWVSPERIDVAFPAASVDVRIRRAGFDIDPGFVPWLGRIVRFHY